MSFRREVAQGDQKARPSVYTGIGFEVSTEGKNHLQCYSWESLTVQRERPTQLEQPRFWDSGQCLGSVLLSVDLLAKSGHHAPHSLDDNRASFSA
ncbi:uncharacterized protein LOC144305495 isoform X2 [Canis aureus]